MATNDDNILLHIILIGFNHRKGGVVEFSHPPFPVQLDGCKEDTDSFGCPSSWKYLPQLTLPDGAHNFQNDTVFFALPSIKQPNQSVYGVSCFRQIPVEDLKIRTSDVTRSSVTKAICALLKFPIYGYIEVKLSLLAQLFFDQGDFSKTEVLLTAYEQLTCCLKEFPMNYDLKYLSGNNSTITNFHVGLSLRELILRWKSKLLTLFKLSLLEKRVIYFGSPVRPISSLILAINSLHPLLIEAGFKEIAYVKPSRSMSPIPDYDTSDLQSSRVIKEKRESGLFYENLNCDDQDTADEKKDNSEESESEKNLKENSVDAFVNNLETLCSIKPSDWIGPIPLYKNGYLCLPFISLSYMDLITDPSVFSYVIGVSNILFRQKKNLADVLVDVQATNIETSDENLKKIIQPSTEDLRFVDYILRNVQNPKENGDGNENWIRRQFNGYFVAMLRSMYENNNDPISRDFEYFNGPYMQMWQKTNNYQEWLTKMITSKAKCPSQTARFEELSPGHPFSGQTLTVQDMKLKIAQTMHNTESGRKINQAYSQAKSTISTWLSSFSSQVTEGEKDKGMKMDEKKDSKVKNNKKIDEEIEEVIQSEDFVEKSV